MCGIVGILSLTRESVSPVVLQRMTDSITHRGPDGEGSFVQDSIGLGHRRLAIIDLTPAGRQPMQTRDGRYVITYNGEIYNFKQIRTELESEGYWFRSNTDSEVVLNAFACWGKECLHKFNGMFAFAIWDTQKKELFLARDRYGIKPLYYSFIDSNFIFASEQKAFKEFPKFKCEIDPKALKEYFTFQNIFSDRTFFKGVKLFPAGHCATISMQDQRHNLELEQYWDFSYGEPSEAKTMEEYAEEMDYLFRRAVKRQLISDVDLGAYLSGGMDSGSIVAVAVDSIPYMKTFTCGFDLSSASGLEMSFDERRAAEHMSYLFKTEHYEMVLKSGDMERILPRYSYYLEDPRVGQSYPNFYVAQLASKFVKVVLSGAGGDELFGGYPWRYYRAVVNSDFSDYARKYYQFWQRLLDEQQISDIFAPVRAETETVDTKDIFTSVFKNHGKEVLSPEEYINSSLYFESKTFLHGLLLVEDKLSMAHSLETRVPFLDNDLVDFAQKLPVHAKLKNLEKVVEIDENQLKDKATTYYQKTNDGKLLLRQVMSRYIPESITDAKKQGFSAPDASWFRGESIDYVRQILHDSNSKIYQVLDKKPLMNLVDEHLEGKQNRRLLIWSLLNVEWWFRNYMD